MGAFFDFANHPGNLYVLATLLPLASFVVLLLAGGLRWFVRAQKKAAGPDHGPAGEAPRKTAAYVATAAIAGSFLLSLIGFVLFASDHNWFAHVEPEDVEGLEARWAGQLDWSHVGSSSVSNPAPASMLRLGYHIDSLTAIMFLMVTLIATLIHLFSIGYMSEELQPEVVDHQVHVNGGHLHRRGRFGRFFLFMSLFCFSMLNLVLADNLFQVFVSWELVGLCSYLLIGFYYERRSASNAAIKAFVTNRVGDAGFIFGLMILWAYVGTFNFQELFQKVRSPQGHKIVRAEIDPSGRARAAAAGDRVLLFPDKAKPDQLRQPLAVEQGAPRENRFGTMPYWALVAAGLGIFLGCVGKSAQFPLHVWLPDAMEGPTPVSALIHAATMVAAGVYLVGRVYPLFTPEALLVIAYTGAITLFVAATIAVVMTDIKKVLAYSTVSQLGYMMLALGVGGWVAGLFHLLTHAFFKALLFLCSGSVIYGCHHEQEMTKMGGLYPKMKATALTMLVGVLAISGIPFFSGWYSKDAILANALAYVTVHQEHLLLFLLPLATAALTVFYMFRMWFMTFTGKPRDHHVFEHAHESPRVMTVPLVVLAVFSVVVAWGTPLYDAEESFLGGHGGVLAASEPKAVKADFPTERAQLSDVHTLAGMLAMGLGALGIVFALLIYYRRVLDPAEAKEQFPGVHRFLWHKWYFDELYSALLVRPVLVVARWCRWFDTRAIDGAVDGTARTTVRLAKGSGRFDLGIIDGLVNLTANVVFGIGRRMRTVQTGYLRSYVLFMVLAAVGLFVLLLYFTGTAPAR
jgi:NADH-quinone oxidoreductase subunit L